VVERLLAGQIQPPTIEGILTWMGLTPEVRGEDAYGYQWARDYPPGQQPGAQMSAQQAAASGPSGNGRPVPVNAVFSGDFVSQLVSLQDTDTVDQAAWRIAAQVVGRRVPPRDAGLLVRLDGRVLPGDVAVAASGIRPLDTVDVSWAEER
jgi:hypothetical protein